MIRVLRATLAVCILAAPPVLAQDSLPFPPVESGSIAKRTMKESTYKQAVEPRRLPADAPNIMIIILDDVGPALPETYGGDIKTPTLSRLAGSGISYNRFHNAAMCSPTRAALLSGRNPHRMGFGQIAELANSWDGYTGSMPPSTATVAKVLGNYGYKTSAFGKWHNTPAQEISAMGPFDRWPAGRLFGFDYFYGFLAGEASQWEPGIVENTLHVEPEKKTGYHFTEDMADKAVTWMRQHRALSPDQPFFMYWAPGAAHGPHHIFKEWADKYKGRFDDGWDAMRTRIFERQKQSGWIPANTILTPRPASLPAWKDIPDAEKPFQRRLMEIFAGFVEHTDTQAGRLIDELERQGIRDNTLIFYVWGDNGSSAEGQAGTISELLAQNGIATKIGDHIRALNELGGLDMLGSPKTDNMYHAGWAWAGSTPHQATKVVASHFGGTRTPLVVSWPKSIKADKATRSQFHHVNDIVPTIYDVLKITPPTKVDGFDQAPIDGTSMMYTFADAKAKGRKGPQYFEVMGSRAIYHDEWIASVFGPRVPWVTGIDPAIATWSPDNDTWELYDLRTDYSQGNDLAAQQPKRVAEMKALFDQEAQRNSVYPIGGGLWSVVLHPEFAPRNPATEFRYTQEIFGVPESAAPKLGTQSSLLAMEVEIAPATKGVLYALGGFAGGLSLWIDEGKLTYEYNLFEIERTRISSSQPLPQGKVKLEVESLRDKAKGRAAPMDVTIRINGTEVAKGRVPRANNLLFTANDAFDVGRDSLSPVSLHYFDRAPFVYNGKIGDVYVKYLP